MDDDLTPTRLERIDYTSTFRFTCLFRCFRMAITPSRLVLALLFIVLAWIAGSLLDGLVWGDGVIVQKTGGKLIHYEWEQFRTLSAEEFDAWSDRMSEDASEDNRAGVFSELVAIQKDLFRNMVSAAIGFRPGFDQFHPGAAPNEHTVIGAIRVMTVTLPAWLWHTHPWFVVFYAAILMALWALLGGAISRQMIVAAGVDGMVPMNDAVSFAARRWLTFLVAPLVPLVIILVLRVALALYGVLFLIPVVNVIGAVGYVFALAIGWVMALLLVLWFTGMHMMYPAISAQASDALDAMARSFSYVMSRPWRLFLYVLVAMVYGAATYLFVGLFIYLMMWMAYWGAGWFGGLEGVFEAPRLGQWPGPAEGAEGSDAPTATVIHVWVNLLIAGLGAYAISFYLATFSQIYLLLRQQTDGDDPADIFEPRPPEPSAPVEKIEPGAVAAPQAAPDSIDDVEAQAPEPESESETRENEP